MSATTTEAAVNLSTVLDLVEKEVAPNPGITAPLKRALKVITHRSGIAPAVLPGRPGAAASLFFHKVQRRPTGPWGESALSVAAFEAQLAHLSKHFRPIALSKLVQLIRERRRIPDRTIVVTFDDGYRNNLVLAAPLLRRYRVPATLFVTTGLIGTDRWMWAYELEEMFLRESPALLGEASGNAQLAQLCGMGLSRRNTALACVQLLKMFPDQQKDEVMQRLRARFPMEVDEENRFLSWDEVREIRNFGVEIGAHTVTHPLLNRLPLDAAEREMVESQKTLERELGEPIRLFAYPNGNSTPELEALAARHFDAAVTTTAGTIHAGAPLASLPRLWGPDDEVELSFLLTRYFISADPWRAFAMP